MPVYKRVLYERALDKSLSINTTAKSLAYFLFREVIEDAHESEDYEIDSAFKLDQCGASPTTQCRHSEV